MGRKRKSKIYFGQEVQDAIIEYNRAESHSLKNKIYQERIHKAFDKLAENIINTFKFSYFDYGFEDVKNEVISFLVMNIHKYNPDKGSKAFSYFSVVAKNYLILHNNNNYKKMKIHDDLDVLNNFDYDDGQTKKNHYKNLLNEIINYFDRNIPILFKTKSDISIAYALIEIFKKRDDIENFNKKFIYLLIREMTDVQTTQITKVTKILKKHYTKLLNEYDRNGYINDSHKFF
mgnify:CR=1 FL=1